MDRRRAMRQRDGMLYTDIGGKSLLEPAIIFVVIAEPGVAGRIGNILDFPFCDPRAGNGNHILNLAQFRFSDIDPSYSRPMREKSISG